eukprot:CAMPEP_0168376934 /NCGR_PEP_ID=MMETSP0228-20121227/10570_1 /TAXON_ID=133427 /ORGANISM="Protoceratium reticulatum, Strain CCCM 535 (=CCMP 1889)" /LENGTH=305 /DNA_ID=CAMNT_0008389923 /DNA_START=54 /DNA_END=971 /DNA_ORIENTATION=-
MAPTAAAGAAAGANKAAAAALAGRLAAVAGCWGAAVANPSQWDALEQDLANALKASEAPLLKPRRSALRINPAGAGPCELRRAGNGFTRTSSAGPTFSDRGLEDLEVACVAQEEAPLRARLGCHTQLGFVPRLRTMRVQSDQEVPAGRASSRDASAVRATLAGELCPSTQGAASSVSMGRRATAPLPQLQNRDSSLSVAATRLRQRYSSPGLTFTQDMPTPRQPSRPSCSASAALLDRRTATVRFRSCSCSHTSSDAECAICFEMFEEDDLVRILPCLHRFHVPCIDPWLLSRWTCPLCKSELAG